MKSFQKPKPNRGELNRAYDYYKTQQNSSIPEQKRVGRFGNGRIAFSLFFILAAIFLAVKWEDITRQDQDSVVLTPEREEEIKKEKEKINDCETYKLVATVNGWYNCLLCEGKSYWLKKNEVFRYGMSCQEQRYKPNWLRERNLKYIPFYWGNFEKCRIVEIESIGNYPLLPENLARLKHLRLAYPPGNASLK